MNERTLHVLEFHKIISSLSDYAATSLGEERIHALSPATDLERVQIMQNETDEAVHILRLDMDVPLGGIFDVTSSVHRSSIGSVLNEKECLDVASTLYGGRQAKVFLEQVEAGVPLLKEKATHITSLRDTERAIKNSIDEFGEMRDDASPTLRQLRSQIHSYEGKIRERLGNIIRRRSKMLSDSIVTIRNDRYVLPVKHEYRSAIGGIVHDQSASGQTLFMEPNAVVEANNELQQVIVKEKHEIQQILQRLTMKIAESRYDIEQNLDVLADIDLICAKAKLARAMDAAKPTMNDQGFIQMKQARHPLIPADEVVANDIEIGKDYHSILITGPNTGGKTVVLKLVGICTLMAQSGLQIPAFDGCELAVFKSVFADIGDEQSIEQSLSTFSSHMTNIVQIIDNVDSESLVLFDELGAGTDPQEGASLAMAILDNVIEKNARVIATTHYPELKAYGYNRENIINASVEFNAETLQPTYRLLLGVPGRSNAFDISRKLGLDDGIIQKAMSQIDTESRSVEAMISSLEHSRKRAEKDYDQAHDILEEADQLLSSLQREWHNYENQKEQLFKRTEERANDVLDKARQEAEQIIADVRKMRDNAGFKEHEWIEAKRQLDQSTVKLTKEDKRQQKTAEETELSVGDDVQVLTINQKGTVVDRVKKNEFVVQVGMMKMTVGRKNLQFLSRQKPFSETETVTTVDSSAAHVKQELDLRGERYEDALHRLEKYVDNALLANYPSVTIIHGKGTGALRTGVQQFADSHPHVTSHRSGREGEGGSGVTVMEFA
ncbi:MAG TPA: endonuclease MutS2 [Bacillota bacterium]|nr:endonuclease MutS2 [Bacillota bacterium]